MEVNDVLLVIGNAARRATIRKFVLNYGGGIRFLDETPHGNIGLEKAFTLNPDIIVIDRWGGFIDGISFSEELLRRHYKCKIILLADTGQVKKELLPDNICDVVDFSSANERRFFSVLKRVAALSSSEFQKPDMASVLSEIKACSTKTEFAILREKMGFSLYAHGIYYVAVCLINKEDYLLDEDSPGFRKEVSGFMKKYSNGLFIDDGLMLYFILNEYGDIDALCRELYSLVKRSLNTSFYFCVANAARNIDELKIRIAEAEDCVKLGYFNVQMPILRVSYIKYNSGRVPVAILDEKLIAIQNDLKEQDFHALTTDISDVFLKIIKPKMDSDGFRYFSDKLLQQYQDYCVLTGKEIDKSLFLYGGENSIEEFSEKLCAAISNTVGIDEAVAFKNPVLPEALRYIRTHYCFDITLSEVAAFAGVSAPYLSRLFKNNMNVNYTEYVNKVRIERAMTFLSEKNIRVYDIAKEVGFQNVKYFNNVFRKYTGMSPKEYRKRHFKSRL